MPPAIQNTPPRLVEHGRIHQGFFNYPFRYVNLLDANNMGGTLGKPLRWLRLKEWVGFGISHSQLYGAMIIQNAKYVANGTAYFYDRVTREYYEWLVLDLPTRVEIPQTLWRSVGRCGRGGRQMVFEHNLDRYRHRVRVRIKETRRQPSLVTDLVLHQDWRRTNPLVVSLPILPDHHTYTHKSPLHLEGTITIGERVYEFDPKTDLGTLDEQKTFYPYHSNWKWGCFAAHSTEGREVVVNFVDQMTSKSEPGEDAMWVDGKLMLLEQPAILPEAEPGAYRIEDTDQRLKLRFSPEGSIKAKRNYCLVAMDYEQYFGRYNGEVVDEAGGVHVVRDAPGALECMVARF